MTVDSAMATSVRSNPGALARCGAPHPHAVSLQQELPIAKGTANRPWQQVEVYRSHRRTISVAAFFRQDL